MKVTKHNRYTLKEWANINENTWYGHLYIAGDYEITKNKLRELAFPKGLCVTLEKLEYIYAAGLESGFRIGLIQYPPFPEDEKELLKKIEKVGYEIAELNHQWSFSIVTKSKTYFYSRRDK